MGSESPIDFRDEADDRISPNAMDEYTKPTRAFPDLHLRTTDLLEALDACAIVGITDQRGRILYVNEPIERLSAYSRCELIGKSHRILNSGYHPKTFWAEMYHELHAGHIWQGEVRSQAKDGSSRWLNATLKPIHDEQGRVRRIVALLFDITPQRQLEANQCTTTRFDDLAGPANRGLVVQTLQASLDRARAGHSKGGFAIFLVDFDRFKTINDSLGHDAGDLLLRQIAERLHALLRSAVFLRFDFRGHTIARMDGDAFIIILDGIRGAREVDAAAEELVELLEAPYDVGGHEVRSTASIGAVLGDESYRNAEEMLRDADTAMYQAKARGKACHVVFDASMREAIQERLQLESDLRRGIGAEEFFLAFQPIVSLEDASLRGVEALVRWNHPSRGLLAPNLFIPLAEETRLILPLGEFVLRRACTELMTWLRTARGPFPEYISVNLSPVQLAQPGIVELITAIVRETGIQPQQLQLEVTETQIMVDPVAARTILMALKKAGIRLAMDDFGTGYSSLSCLHQLPFDVLKIDRSFILNLVQGREFVAMAHSIVTLAEYLGMTCVAEGVEHSDQIATLQGMGCADAQGYFFGKPVPGHVLFPDPDSTGTLMQEAAA